MYLLYWNIRANTELAQCARPRQISSEGFQASRLPAFRHQIQINFHSRENPHLTVLCFISAEQRTTIWILHRNVSFISEKKSGIDLLISIENETELFYCYKCSFIRAIKDVYRLDSNQNHCNNIDIIFHNIKSLQTPNQHVYGKLKYCRVQQSFLP